MNVKVTLGHGQIEVGQVETDEEPDADGTDELRAAAVAWNALTRSGVFVVGGQSFTAAECAEWWE